MAAFVFILNGMLSFCSQVVEAVTNKHFSKLSFLRAAIMYLHELPSLQAACTDENDSLKHQLIRVSAFCVGDGEIDAAMPKFLI